RCSDARSIEAELVIDATGRGHRARRWLTSIGFPPPAETEIGLDTAYSTANFRKPDSFPGEPIIFITGPAPQFTRRGYVITIENDTLLVSLIGRFGDFPPTDKQGFRAFAGEPPSDFAHPLNPEAEQLPPIAHPPFVSSVQRPARTSFFLICPRASPRRCSVSPTATRKIIRSPLRKVNSRRSSAF